MSLLMNCTMKKLEAAQSLLSFLLNSSAASCFPLFTFDDSIIRRFQHLSLYLSCALFCFFCGFSGLFGISFWILAIAKIRFCIFHRFETLDLMEFLCFLHFSQKSLTIFVILDVHPQKNRKLPVFCGSSVLICSISPGGEGNAGGFLRALLFAEWHAMINMVLCSPAGAVCEGDRRLKMLPHRCGAG